MADITPNTRAGAANSTAVPNTSAPIPAPTDPGAGANLTAPANIFSTPPREGFDDDPASMFHPDNQDGDSVSDISEDPVPTVSLSIRDRLQLAAAIDAQPPETVHTVLCIEGQAMTARIYGKAIARAMGLVRSSNFHTEADKQLGERAAESKLDQTMWTTSFALTLLELNRTIEWARQHLPELQSSWSSAINDIPVVEEPLDRYHRHAHIAATRHMITLYEACQAGHRNSLANAIRTQNYTGLSQGAANALRALSSLNGKIVRYNRTKNRSESIGKIRFQLFFDPWSSSEAAKLRALCKTLRLPEGWGELPPVERYKYAEDDGMYWVPLWHQLTPLLMKVWDAIVKGASEEQIGPICDEVSAKLRELNSKISELNLQNDQLPRLHHIDSDIISAAYLAVLRDVQDMNKFRETRASIDSSFAELGYPETWTPRATTECIVCMDLIRIGATNYNQCPTCQVKVHTDCKSQWAKYHRDISGNSDFPCPHCRAMTSTTTISPATQTATQSQTATQISSLRNMGKRRVQIPPRKVSRCVRPGYTVHGQRISHINIYGNFAQVVVENEDGSRELLNATQAGGLAVVKAAESFPEVGKVESSGWKELRSKVSEMGEYGILWVAVSSHWNPTSERLPSVVCCFYHHVNGVYTEKVGSRSNIAKVLGKAGDLMIAEAVGTRMLNLLKKP
ncbi:hypothetical protein ACJ73_05429 [Blastomyces percursus]|uniref:RING-type domain-containing protein n=1 Tax=Blastomyces percursus TaxID=1658174 RepID=A0A1J9QSL1_9EURO|nr:hypothetical protein ACJ73_05429 [Blastomyces percursus]